MILPFGVTFFLERIYLNSNGNIGGTLPTSLGKLSKLGEREHLFVIVYPLIATAHALFVVFDTERLHLTVNSINGPIPIDIFQMTSLGKFPLSVHGAYTTAYKLF
jgi:hypothetical protein